MRLIDMSVASYPSRFAAHRASSLTGMVLGLTLLLAAHTQAATVSLAWDAVASSGGYKLYYSTQKGNYTTIDTIIVDVGPVTNRSVTIADPPSPQTYYFVVTAYDSSRSIESGFSNEVSTLLQPTPPPSTPPPPSPPSGSTIMLETEGMILTGYIRESTSAASGGALISRRDAGGAAPGTATMVFPGPTGTYTIIVWYFDENDGQCTFAVTVNGIEVDTWRATADFADSGASSVTRTSRTVPIAVPLAAGDRITLKGSEQGGEYARFDRIDFVPVSSAPVAIVGRVAAYAFEATSGTTASEASGNGTNGVLTNGAVFAAGKYGNGVRLDGANAYVNLFNPASLRLTGSMTLSAWINASDFPFDDAAIISKRQSSNVGYQLDTTIDTAIVGGAGTLQFSAATFSVAENGGNATVTITRTGGSAGAVGVSVATSNGTASAPADYTAVTQSVSFAAGDTANKTVSIPIIDNTLGEGNETVTLTLSSPTGGATLGSPRTAVLTITDNDGGVTLNASPTTVAPGGTLTATWGGMPSPSATDWLGLYTPGAAATAFIHWIYVSCSQTPGAARAAGSCPFGVPSTVAPGTYQLRLLANDGFTLRATSTNFTVAVDSGPRTIGFKISDASGNTVARYGATTLLLNTWYHVAGVYDATNRTMNVYLNGQLDNGVLVGTIPAAQPDSNQNVNIGQRPGSPGTFNFEGMLDDVRIYNRALSASDIQADMNRSPSLSGQ